MKKKFKKVMAHPLISGSIVLVFGSFAANIFNFLYNVVMVRLLSKSDFGTLSSVNAICGYAGIAAAALTPLIIILAGGYFVENRNDLIKGLFIKLGKFFLLGSVIVSAIFFILIPQMNSFFNINNFYLLVLADGVIFVSLMSALNNGFLQAKLAFKFYVFILFAIAIIRLVVSSFFVIFGWGVTGAVAGLFVGILIPYLLSFIPFRFIFERGKVAFPKIESKIFYGYGALSILIGIGLSGFIANDLILVKHYFDSDVAGLYAGLSLIGKIIFYVSSPITGVMFPLIVQQRAKGENFNSTFFLSMLMVFVSSLAITVFYTLFPKFSTLFVLKNPEYLAIMQYVTFFAVNISVYSLLSVLVNFYLSIKKTMIVIPIVVASLVQVFLITLFHSDIQQIVTISFWVNFMIFVVLLFYYPVWVKRSV